MSHLKHQVFFVFPTVISLVAIVVPSIVPLLISAVEITTFPEPLGVKEISPFAPSAIVILPELEPLFVLNVKSLVRK